MKERRRIIIFCFSYLCIGFCVAFVLLAGCAALKSTSTLISTPAPTPAVSKIPIVPETTTRSFSLAAYMEKIEKEKAASISNAIDYTNPITRDFAVMQIKKSSGGSFNDAQICDIWDVIHSKWTYVNDPNGLDYYSSASRTINVGLKGDCDDFAILNAAVIESIGGNSRIISACNYNGECHAYAEALVGIDQVREMSNYIGEKYGVYKVYYRTSDKLGEYWLNLDWQADHPGGEYFNDSGKIDIYYPDGRYEISLDSRNTIISQTVLPIKKQLDWEKITPAPTLDFSELGKKTLLPTPTIDWSNLDKFDLLTPTPTPTIDWSNLNKINLLTPTPTPTIDFSKIYRI